MAKKANIHKNLQVPDLSKISIIAEEFLHREEQRAKDFARLEISHFWVKYREILVEDLYKINTEKVPVAEAIIINHLKNCVKSGDVSTLFEYYNRVLGKPKESKIEYDNDNVTLTIDLLAQKS